MTPNIEEKRESAVKTVSTKMRDLRKSGDSPILIFCDLSEVESN